MKKSKKHFLFLTLLLVVSFTLILTACDNNEVKTNNTPKVTYTDVAIVPATCDETGVKAHYLGSDGKLYIKDADGNYVVTTEAELVIEALGHDYEGAVVTYTWADDGSKCTASRKCKNDATHIDTLSATITSAVTKAATCTEKGQTTYTASFNKPWAATQTKVIENIEALGHDFEGAVVTYTWADDGSTCTATRKCKNDATHIDTLSATITSAVTKAATCTEKGQTTYTATFNKPWAATQTMVIKNIEPLGHDYEVTYIWADDGSTCTALRKCKNDASHKENLAGIITSAVTKAATCTEKGQTTYTATFTKAWAATQTKVVDNIEALGHDFEGAVVTYTWADDGSTCTATRKCKNDPNHTETANGTISSNVTTQPTFDAKGQTTYTATFDKTWTSTQTKVIEDIEMLVATRAIVSDLFNITDVGRVLAVRILNGEIVKGQSINVFDYETNTLTNFTVKEINKKDNKLDKAIVGDEVGLLTDLPQSLSLKKGNIVTNVTSSDNFAQEVKGTYKVFTEAEGGIGNPVFSDSEPLGYFYDMNQKVKITFSGLENNFISPGTSEEGIILTLTYKYYFKLGDVITLRNGGKTIGIFTITNIGSQSTELKVGDTFVKGDWEYKCTANREVIVSKFIGKKDGYIKLPNADLKSNGAREIIEYMGLNYHVVGYENNLIAADANILGVIVEFTNLNSQIDINGVIDKSIDIYLKYEDIPIDDAEFIELLIGTCENKVIEYAKENTANCWHYDTDGITPVKW